MHTNIWGLGATPICCAVHTQGPVRGLTVLPEGEALWLALGLDLPLGPQEKAQILRRCGGPSPLLPCSPNSPSASSPKQRPCKTTELGQSTGLQAWLLSHCQGKTTPQKTQL